MGQLQDNMVPTRDLGYQIFVLSDPSHTDEIEENWKCYFGELWLATEGK
jgi:hypothetical protein